MSGLRQVVVTVLLILGVYLIAASVDAADAPHSIAGGVGAALIAAAVVAIADDTRRDRR